MSEVIKISSYDKDFGDWSGLLSLIHEAFSYMDSRINPPSSLHRLTVQSIEQKARDGFLLLAWDESKLVGCVFIDEREDTLYIGKLAVDPNYRKNGIGTDLIKACKEMAREKHKDELELQTRVELKENHAYFKSLGFRKTGDTTHEGFNRPTSITMRCRLSS